MYTGPLYITSDHAGFPLKARLVEYLTNELHIPVIDMGAHVYDEGDDYPDFVIPTAEKAVAEDGRAIMICGMGIGESIAANKVKGMRAALGYNIEAARLSRVDNNANGLCLAGRVLTDEHAMAIVRKWLETDFGAGRHERRVKKIEAYEEKE